MVSIILLTVFCMNINTSISCHATVTDTLLTSVYPALLIKSSIFISKLFYIYSRYILKYPSDALFSILSRFIFFISLYYIFCSVIHLKPII